MILKKSFKILLLLIALLAIASCDLGSIKEEADGSIIYEGIRYVSVDEKFENICFDKTATEIGNMRKSVIFPGLIIYKLDNDSFLAGGRSMNGGLFDAVWIREDLIYPLDSAVITSLYIDDYSERINLEIDNVTFYDIFTKCSIPQDTISDYYFCLAYYIEEIDTTVIKKATYLADTYGNFYIIRRVFEDDEYHTECYLLAESIAHQIRKSLS